MKGPPADFVFRIFHAGFGDLPDLDDTDHPMSRSSKMEILLAFAHKFLSDFGTSVILNTIYAQKQLSQLTALI